MSFFEVVKLKNLKLNWKAGLTVSLVSIPLSVALALASGTTPTVGIITAIWAGLFASLFGGSDFNVVGPTGALSGIISMFLFANGQDQMAAMTLIAAVFIMLGYFFRIDRYLVYIPSSVIHGFSLGVAFVIGFGQVNNTFGINVPAKLEAFEKIKYFFENWQMISFSTLAITIVSVAVIFWFKKKFKSIPGVIVVSILGIFIGYLSSKGFVPFEVLTMGSKYGEIPFKLFSLPAFHFSVGAFRAGASVALIALIESLLSAKVADGMTKTYHNPRKEMFGLSLANFVCALTGGMPATAALARTSLNIKAGAKSRTSGILSAIFIVAIASVSMRMISYLPLAVVAGALIYVAIGMVEQEHYIRFFKLEKASFVISILVALITFYEDPIIAILFGISVNLLIFTEKSSRMQCETSGQKVDINGDDENDDSSRMTVLLKKIKENEDILLYSIKGKLCYLNGRAYLSSLQEEAEGNKIVIIRLRDLFFVDYDGAEIFDEMVESLMNKGINVLISGTNHSAIDTLSIYSKTYVKLMKDGKVFNKTTHALTSLGIGV